VLQAAQFRLALCLNFSIPLRRGDNLMPIRFILILGAFVISVLMWVDRACISAAIDDMAADLGFSDAQMGWVMAAFSLGYALFQVPSGKLADRFGPRIVMTIVCLAWSLFTALTGVVRGLLPMIGLRFLFGIGESGGYPTLARAFCSWLPMNERGITTHGHGSTTSRLWRVVTRTRRRPAKLRGSTASRKPSTTSKECWTRASSILLTSSPGPILIWQSVARSPGGGLR
jgi:hypothetical protein